MITDIKSKDGNTPLTPPWKRRLYLPSYTLAESAHYVRTTPQLLANWFYYAGEVGPALPGKEKRRPLSYLQLIEAAFVATMRKKLSLQKIRKAREYARQTFHVEFPFAELRWKTEGTHLLVNLRDVEGDGDIDSLIAGDKGGQEGWESVMAERFEEFDYESGLALTWHVRGKDCPITIDPRFSFGAPRIGGLPTWVIKGRWEAQETIPEIQEDFGLAPESIRYALEFEGITKAA